MRVCSLGRRGFLFLSLFVVLSFCNGDEQTFEVAGLAECVDCKEHNLKSDHALKGLHVTIDCKLKTGVIKRVGSNELDEGGKFKIPLTKEIIQDDRTLKEECYAQLHSAAAIPCPTRDSLEATKIVFKSQTNGKNVFSPTKPLQFSSALCTSKFLWPYFKYPPLPKAHPWKKNWPKISFPPLYKPKPLPPSTPTYKPPVVKPKPKPPVIKPLPPAPPTYKPKPKPKPKVPTYKPKPPVYEPPKKPLPTPAPIYKPPSVTKPLPPPFPLYPIPPFYKKPCPPLPKIHPKYFHHPMFGYFPPLPPLFPKP